MNTLSWIIVCVVCFLTPCVAFAIQYYVRRIRTHRIGKKLIKAYEEATDPYERDELCYRLIQHGLMRHITQDALQPFSKGPTYNPELIGLSPDEIEEHRNEQRRNP